MESKEEKLEIVWNNGNTTTLTFSKKKFIEDALKKLNSFFCRSILLGKEGERRYLIVKRNVNSISYKGENKK